MRSPERTTELRRLDHVAIVVRDTEAALGFYSGHLGLTVQSSQEIANPPVRLTYLDAGNAYIQLVEPLSSEGPLVDWLDEHGDGLHHICFGVDDVAASAASFSDEGAPIEIGTGRGRPSSFLTCADATVRIELTGFDRDEDVEALPGWLAPPG